MGHPDPHDTDVTVVLGMSGGKDSGATSLWLTEQGIEHKRVLADTGWEFNPKDNPVFDNYIDYVREHIGPVDVVRAKVGFADLCRQKGAFPGRSWAGGGVGRFCTDVLKHEPIKKYLQAFDTDVINVVGIRAAESRARRKLADETGPWEWSEGFDCWVWRPLLEWTLQDVIDIHQRHGITPNPLYWKYGMKRVGCAPCIFAGKDELTIIAKHWPERIDEIRQLEADVQRIALERYKSKGFDSFEAKGHQPPTMFIDKGRRMRMMPIDEYVAWASTSYGGKQIDMFKSYETERDGCMRWGLCDTGELD
jgi:3'-phosphoadenosine 5'-phosphosulfate sulfotransferase (PAPS reductase)/FAD synthetase